MPSRFFQRSRSLECWGAKQDNEECWGEKQDNEKAFRGWSNRAYSDMAGLVMTIKSEASRYERFKKAYKAAFCVAESTNGEERVAVAIIPWADSTCLSVNYHLV
jgi:hypothetical protein